MVNYIKIERDLQLKSIKNSHSIFLTGNDLSSFLSTVDISSYYRKIYERLDAYLKGEHPGRICELYGFPRTGKRTLMYQAMQDLPHDQTIFVKIHRTEAVDRLSLILRYYCDHGVRYIFIANSCAGYQDCGEISWKLSCLASRDIRIVQTDQSMFSLSEASSIFFDDHETAESLPLIYRISTDVLFEEYAIMTGVTDPLQYSMYGGMCPDRKGRHGFVNSWVSYKHTLVALSTAMIAGANTQGERCGLRSWGHNYDFLEFDQNEYNTYQILRIFRNMVREILFGIDTNNRKMDTPSSGANSYSKEDEEKVIRIADSIGVTYGATVCRINGDDMEERYCRIIGQPAITWQLVEQLRLDSDKQALLRKRILEILAKRGLKVHLSRLVSFSDAGSPTVLIFRKKEDSPYVLLEFCHSDTSVEPGIICNQERLRILEKHFGQIEEKGIIWYGQDDPARNLHDIRNYLGKASDVETYILGEEWPEQ